MKNKSKDGTNRSWRTTLKFTVIFSAISISIVALVLASTGFAFIENHKTQMKQHYKTEVSIISSRIKNDLKEIIHDLLFIARDENLKILLLSPHDQQDLQVSISNQISRFSLAKGYYDQIRILNSDGMEIIRVDYKDGKSIIVPKDKLQNKKGRYYFTDTIQLNPEEIFVSPLDLNIGHGEIEQPLKPMIRLGMPLTDKAGNKLGIVILNYYADNILAKVNKASDSPEQSHVCLLNSDGYWLKAPKSEMEWGFMYSDRHKQIFGNLFPHVWKEMATSDSGQILADGNIFTYSTIYPLFEKWENRFNKGDGATVDLANRHEYYWKVISHLPASYSQAFVGRLLGRFLVILFSFSILLVICSWRIAKNFTMRHQAENDRKQSELKFRTLYESSSDAVMLLDEKGFFDCNEATVKIFACKDKEDFCSKHPADLSPAAQPCGTDSMKFANKQIATAVKEGSNSFEWVHQKIDGTEFLAEVLLNAMELDGKGVIQAVVRDITVRKQAEKKLKKSMDEIEQFNRLMTGREERVIQMKMEVNSLLAELGRDPEYKSVMEETEAAVSCDKAG